MMCAKAYSRGKGSAMGVKSAEALDVSFDELPNYLHAKHSVYMEVGGATY